jgi:acetoacetyl-CoA synthetase
MNEGAPILWTPGPDRVASARLTTFRRAMEQRTGLAIPDYDALHAWSIADKAAFWTAIWEQCGVIGDRGDRALIDADAMPGARFFPDASLNFAENLLRRTDQGVAIIAMDETGVDRQLTWAELRESVRRAAWALRHDGVTAGDRVAAVTANTPDAIIVALAAASIGAIWSSCSPDFGVQGILVASTDTPTLLFATLNTAGGKTLTTVRRSPGRAAAIAVASS